MSEEMVTISKKEYEQLQHESLLLDCLRGVGVDSWSGWDWACEMLQQIEDDGVGG
jgi:hypothetical protein